MLGYKAKKAAQVVAFFADKEGGNINVLKLTKLIYLADRESLKRFDYPILYDKLVSMEHGPVDSKTLDLINGLSENRDWDLYIRARENHTIGLVAAISRADLDELSDANIEVLEGVWQHFGRMGKYEIRDYTHDNCPEWEDPDTSSIPIPYERILKYLGKEDSSELAKAIEVDRFLLG